MQPCIRTLEQLSSQELDSIQADTTSASKHLQAQRHLLLAQAYETNEAQDNVVKSLSKALQEDSQCCTAFNRLLDCHLISIPEMRALVDKMVFATEDAWLRDYYLQRVGSEEAQEALVKLKISDVNSSHLYQASDHDESGLATVQFQADMDEDMHGELRNPAAPHALDSTGKFLRR